MRKKKGKGIWRGEEGKKKEDKVRIPNAMQCNLLLILEWIEGWHTHFRACRGTKTAFPLWGRKTTSAA